MNGVAALQCNCSYAAAPTHAHAAAQHRMGFFSGVAKWLHHAHNPSPGLSKHCSTLPAIEDSETAVTYNDSFCAWGSGQTTSQQVFDCVMIKTVSQPSQMLSAKLLAVSLSMQHQPDQICFLKFRKRNTTSCRSFDGLANKRYFSSL
jgi:hypothetical protein